MRIASILLGAMVLAGFAGLATSADAACRACAGKPTEVRVKHKVVNHTRVVTTNKVVPRVRVVNHNRVILHKQVVDHRYHTIRRENVEIRNIIVHRHNTANRYARVDNVINTSSRQVNVRYTTQVRHVQGTNCDCGGGSPARYAAKPASRRAVISARY